jgi:hypothetical protein
MRHHIVITGTGRAGTTFLVELFTHLRFDTGFTPEDIPKWKNKRCNAGLEHNIRRDDAPYIVKCPAFCDYVDQVVQNPGIEIDVVYVPIRKLEDAAESRRKISAQGYLAGGLWGTMDPEKQEEILMSKLYNLLFWLSRYQIPVVFLQYPLMIQDRHYLREKLVDILWTKNQAVFKNEFTYAFLQAVDINDS